MYGQLFLYAKQRMTEDLRLNLQLVVCPDAVKDRQAWMKEHLPGAEGLLCMLSDKVGITSL